MMDGRAAMATLLVCGTLSGCVTPWGVPDADKTVQSLKTTRADLVAADEQVGSAITALDRLASASGADVLPAYDQFSLEVRAIETHANLARTRAEAYRDNAKAYTDSWRTELAKIEDGPSRFDSAIRRAEVMKAFRYVELSAAVTRQAYGPLIVILQGIERDLGEDLKQKDVEAMQLQFDEARLIAGELRKRVARLRVALDALHAALISQVP